MAYVGGTITKLTTFGEIVTTCKETFYHNFGAEPQLACCAPGRVNLIGEHIDYNDGFVLPMALPMVTLVVGSYRSDSEVHIITCHESADEPRHITFSLIGLVPGKPKWANYVKGVVNGFVESFGPLENGFNAVFGSNVPVGGGLSSSAAIEVATLTFLEKLTGKFYKNDVERALMCQAAEHKFVGMPCGIMDQTISVAARRDHVLLLDCRSFEVCQIPFVASERDLVVLICNSDVRHELSSSEYPTRRLQCSKALELIGVNSFRDATENDLSEFHEKFGQSIDGELLLKRARHVITEIKRTQDAAVLLLDHNYHKFGELMTQSHTSLRDDFQVSCTELDVLVNAAIKCPGVLGSRMTGGGFGGCTVTLLRRDAVEKVIFKMREYFVSKFNKDAGERLEFYICTPSDGAQNITL